MLLLALLLLLGTRACVAPPKSVGCALIFGNKPLAQPPAARARSRRQLCQPHARSRAASSASRGGRRCCGVATEGTPCWGWQRRMVVFQRVEQKLSMFSSMILRMLSTATNLQANNHSRVYILIISLYHQTIIQQEKSPLGACTQQEMCDKTERCILGPLACR